VSARQYVHPQFHDGSPKHRFRRGLWLVLACLGVAGIGAVISQPGARKSDAAPASDAQASRPETIPAVTPIGYAAVDPQPAAKSHAQVAVQKPTCLGPDQFDGSCVPFQLPKVRMVRVPRASSASQHGNSPKPAIAVNPKSKDLDREVAEPRKLQRSAHRHSQRRHHQPSATGYASTWRGDPGRQGFARSFW
jgi:hypothetical protein